MGASTGSRSLQGIGDQTSYWFKNFSKNTFDLGGVASDSWPGLLDKYGYPTSGSFVNNIGMGFPTPTNYTGNWVISFDGVGEIKILATPTAIISDIDSCITQAGGEMHIISNAASEARGRTRVVINLGPIVPNQWILSYVPGSTKYSNIGGSAPNQLSSMSNFVFCRCSSPYGDGGITPAGDELDIQSGDLTRAFNTDTLAVYSALNFKIGRMMGFVTTNFNNVTSQNSTRWPLTGVTWLAPRFDPTTWVGTTAGTNGSYTCSAAPGTSGAFVSGEQLQLKFHATQPVDLALSGVTVTSSLITLSFSSVHGLSTGDFIFINAPGVVDVSSSGLLTHYQVTVTDTTHCTIVPVLVSTGGTFTGAYTGSGAVCKAATINPGGRGARVIIDQDGVAPADFFTGATITANTIATLSYDADIDAWSFAPGGIPGAPPVEVAVAFMNKLGKDMWWNFPINMSVAAAVEQATYIRDHLTPGLNVYFECGNENWNFAFSQAHYLNSKSIRMGFTNVGGSHWELMMARIFQAIGNIWSGGVGLKRVVAVATFQGNGNGGNGWLEHLLLSPSLNSTTTPSYTGPNYSTVGNRVTDNSDAISYAPYFSGAQAVQFEGGYSINAFNFSSLADLQGLLTAADNFAAGGSGINTALNWIDNDVRQGTFEPKAITINPVTGVCTLNSGTLNSINLYQGSSCQLFVSGGSLPSPLVATVFGASRTTQMYWVVNAPGTGNTFQLSLTKTGTPITGLTGGSGTFSVGVVGATMSYYLNIIIPQFETIAATYNKEVSQYEGGQSSWFPSAGACTTAPPNGLGLPDGTYSQKILNLIVGYQQSPQMQATVKYGMDQFMSIGVHSAHPAQLQVVGENSWSLLQGFTAPVSGDNSTFAGDITCAHNSSFASVADFNSEGNVVPSTSGGGKSKSHWQKGLAALQPTHSSEVKNAAAVLSKMGGHARAAALTPTQRSQIASTAAKARWK